MRVKHCLAEYSVLERADRSVCLSDKLRELLIQCFKLFEEFMRERTHAGHMFLRNYKQMSFDERVAIANYPEVLGLVQQPLVGV